MLCCTVYTAFRVILVNTLLAGFNFAINAVAFISNHWAVSDSETGGCKNYLFVGLREYKLGYSGCANGDDYEIERIDECADISLTGDDCDTFEDAVYMGQSACAMSVLLLAFMAVNLFLAYGNNHNRILWLLQVGGTVGNILFACLAFAACGYFEDVLKELPSTSSDPSLGYGWGLELFSGLTGLIAAGLCLLVVIKGIGENTANGGKNVA